jgi:KH domain
MESLVMLDRLFGLLQFSIQIPLNLHAIVNGRKRVSLNEIMNESRTSFYFPIGFGEAGFDEVVVTGLGREIEIAVEKYMGLVRAVVWRPSTKYYKSRRDLCEYKQQIFERSEKIDACHRPWR